MKLILQPGHEGREAFVCCVASPLGVIVSRPPHTYSQRDLCPVGDVPFCEDVMRKQGIAIQKPDFYPEFLSSWLRRKVLLYKGNDSHSWPFFDTFVKSAESYKQFPAHVLSVGDNVPGCEVWMSGVVNFTQEWRYYVSNGQVATTGWYDGSDDDEPAPVLDIKWPAGFCGAVDFGRLDTGEIALVESHHPYACGHYSDDNQAFVQWLIDGFEYMKENFSV